MQHIIVRSTFDTVSWRERISFIMLSNLLFNDGLKQFLLKVKKSIQDITFDTNSAC